MENENKMDIHVFFGFQLKSHFYKESDKKKFVNFIQTDKLLNSHVNLKVTPGEFSIGGDLNEEVRKAITMCDLAIFDISENNPNVMYEIGLMSCQQKGVFLIKNVGSAANEVPSDVRGHIYEMYEKNYTDTKFKEKIKSALLKWITNNFSTTPTYASFWGLNNSDIVYIITSDIESLLKENEQSLNQFYIGNNGDKDAMLEIIHGLTAVFPGIRIEYKNASEFDQDKITENLIIIGGPDYNKYYDIFDDELKLPVEFQKNDDEGRYSNGVRLRNGGENRTKFEPEAKKLASSGSEVVKDIGIFFKLPHAYNKSKSVFLISGLTIYGVYGIAKSFISQFKSNSDEAYNNCKKILEVVKNRNKFGIIQRVIVHDRKAVIMPQVNFKNNDTILVLDGDDNFNESIKT